MRNAILLLTLLAGCPDSGDSPRQACEATVSALCERFYACYTPAELSAAHLPSSQAACITMLEDQQGCAAMTLDNVCTGNDRYSADEAAKCSDQVAGLACSQIRDPLFDAKKDAPACAQVCAVPN